MNIKSLLIGSAAAMAMSSAAFALTPTSADPPTVKVPAFTEHIAYMVAPQADVVFVVSYRSVQTDDAALYGTQEFIVPVTAVTFNDVQKSDALVATEFLTVTSDVSDFDVEGIEPQASVIIDTVVASDEPMLEVADWMTVVKGITVIVNVEPLHDWPNPYNDKGKLEQAKAWPILPEIAALGGSKLTAAGFAGNASVLFGASYPIPDQKVTELPIVAQSALG